MKRPFLLLLILLSLSSTPTSFAQTMLNEIDNTPLAQSIAGDFNGDGLTDYVSMAKQSQPGQLQLTTYLGRGDGFTTGIQNSFFAIDPSITITSFTPGPAADFNGDNKLDIAFPAVQNGNGVILIVTGKGDGTFDHVQTIALPSQFLPVTYFCIADLNHDGHQDLLVQSGGLGTAGNVATVLGNGDGTFQAPVVTSNANLGGIIAVGDVNEDGFPDLLLEPYSISLGNGHGGFGTASAIDVGMPSGPSIIAILQFLGIQDLNGDDKPDLLFFETVDDQLTFSQTVNLVFLPGNGDGTFAAAQIQIEVAPGESFGSEWYDYYPFMMDLNQDGKPDVVMPVANDLEGGGTCCRILLSTGKGDGTFNDGYDLSSYSESGPPNVPFNAYSGSAFALNFGNSHIGFVNGNGLLFLPEPSAPGSPYIPPGIYIPQYYLAFSAPSSQIFQFAGTSDLAVSAITAQPPLSVSDPNLSDPYFLNAQITLSSSPQNSISGLVSITSNNALNPINVPVFGNLAGPLFSISPSSLNFGYVKDGTTSSLSITLANTSGSPAAITQIAMSGDSAFTNTSNCTGEIATSCTISVVFAPTKVAASTGSIVITDQNGRSASVSLQGNGYQNGPGIEISPTNIAFGNQQVGTTSAAIAATVTNTGDAPANVQSITTAAPFAIQKTQNCMPIQPAGVCGVYVTFAPTIPGPQTGTVTIVDSAPSSPQAIPLSGVGTAIPVPQLTITPTTLDFGSNFLGATSLPQNVTLQNTGTAPVTIQSVETTGPFSSLNACGNSIAPGFSCIIGVFFQTSTTGAQTGALTITDNVSGGPQTVQLSGIGSTVTVAPSSGSSTSATINYGGTATYKLTVQSQDGYIGSLAVTCTNAPFGMQCTPNPDSLAFTANASTATVVFTVAPAGAAKSATSSFQWIMGSVVSVALLLGIFPARLRRQRCELIGYLAFLAACFLLWTMAACGGGNSSSGMTTEANYTLQAVFTTPTGESVNQPLKLTVIQQSAQ